VTEAWALFTGIFLGFVLGAWMASPGDGSLGHNCKPDGTCQGSLVCMAGEITAPRGGLQQAHRCQLPPASAK